jgi:hypothetical protein
MAFWFKHNIEMAKSLYHIVKQQWHNDENAILYRYITIVPYHYSGELSSNIIIGISSSYRHVFVIV